MYFFSFIAFGSISLINNNNNDKYMIIPGSNLGHYSVLSLSC